MELKDLTQLDGVSGNENAVRKFVMEHAKPLCDEVKIDRQGSVICYKKGTAANAPCILLSAHMDEVGFIIADATEEGHLYFRAVGGIDPRVIISKHVRVGEKKLPGVIGAMAIHLQTPEDRKRVLDYDNLYIDIGAKDKEDALKNAPQGTYAYFETDYMEFGDGCVSAKALDDRIGCYNMLRILEGTYPCDLVCAFVVQEEVGLRGSKAAGFAVQPDIALVLEGTAANDMGDTKDVDMVCRAGRGVAVSFMDTASIADRQTYKQLLALAQKNNISYQVKKGVTGGNDAASYQRAAGGARTCVLSVPCRYIHGPSSVCSMADVDAQYELAKAFLMEGK